MLLQAGNGAGLSPPPPVTHTVWCMPVESAVKEWTRGGSSCPTQKCPGGVGRGALYRAWSCHSGRDGAMRPPSQGNGVSQGRSVGLPSSRPSSSPAVRVSAVCGHLSLSAYLWPRSSSRLCYKDKWNLTRSWHLVRNFLFLNK